MKAASGLLLLLLSACSSGASGEQDDAMTELVQARARAGKHLALVDMYGAFTDDAQYRTTLLHDLYHPRDAGYARMAVALV